ncbi:MAG: DUF721 domain-containing protein [Clostridium sp.]|nr:DUF721 domain-containing protein [Prevotella sp.]MCM1428451.1 DUF721 domain-containing protein [Clostridium sp.]MCM1474916.1 DUF721 domain-containing protein [Muribaculaceae bacterium]
MKRVQTLQFGDVLRQTIQECEMTDRLDEIEAARCWAIVIGEAHARRSPMPTVHKGVMTVRLQSAALRQEFTQCRSELVKAINTLMHREIITDIRFCAL